MTFGYALRRVGSASPLVPAVGYCAVLTLANLVGILAPKNFLAVLISFVAWIAAGLLFFIIVTWYRDDDWLAAGFLLGLGLLVSGIVASTIALMVASGSIGGAIFTSATLSMTLLVRAIFIVPLSGGLVALARWISQRFSRKRPADQAATHRLT